MHYTIISPTTTTTILQEATASFSSLYYIFKISTCLYIAFIAKKLRIDVISSLHFSKFQTI